MNNEGTIMNNEGIVHIRPKYINAITTLLLKWNDDFTISVKKDAERVTVTANIPQPELNTLVILAELSED
jgi:hypothetical protein